jgi:hypothetical protein
MASLEAVAVTDAAQPLAGRQRPLPALQFRWLRMPGRQTIKR